MPDRPAADGFGDVAPLAHGLTWEDQPVGFRFRSAARTVTETDLVSFVGLAGFIGSMFLDARRATELGYRGRVVPGMLTLVLAEGLVLQTNVLHGTGIAFLGLEMEVRDPVYVGDTVEVVVEVTASRATSRPGRGIVTSTNTVLNQEGDVVLVYRPTRMQRGVGAEEAG
ncbi:MAG: MaoC family dehydratase N-terminal domain-containing protein [Acidimicrobiia bacterium]